MDDHKINLRSREFWVEFREFHKNEEIHLEDLAETGWQSGARWMRHHLQIKIDDLTAQLECASQALEKINHTYADYVITSKEIGERA